jgi:hypothetical protein
VCSLSATHVAQPTVAFDEDDESCLVCALIRIVEHFPHQALDVA